MKKTKINVGAILIIIFVVISIMLSGDYFSLVLSSETDTGGGYAGAYQNYIEDNAEEVYPGDFSNYDDYYDVLNQKYTGLYLALDNMTNSNALLIVFGTVAALAVAMLFGKRWGAIGIGASMATMLVMTLLSKFVFAISTIGDESNTIATALIYILFVSIPGILGWLTYAAAGVFSSFAENSQKKSLIAMILKIAAATLVAVGGMNQILCAFISLFVQYQIRLGGVIKSIILAYGIPAVLVVASYIILAAGMVLSVKCKPENLPEIKAEAVPAAE